MIKISDVNYEIFSIDPNAQLSVGDVVDLSVSDNMIVVIKSNGVHPIGVIEYFYGQDKVVVRFTQHKGITDNFDVNEIYPVNANLYVENGKFTTALNKNKCCVGM